MRQDFRTRSVNMLRSRDGSRNTSNPKLVNVDNDDTRSPKSSFSKGGMITAILFVLVVLYLVYSHNSHSNSSPVADDQINPTSKRSLKAPPPLKRKFMREPVGAANTRQALNDLSGMDAFKLKKLIQRRDRLPNPLKSFNSRLTSLKQLSSGHLNPLNALKEQMDALKDDDEDGIDGVNSKEITFTVNDVFVRQTIPLGAAAEETDDVVLMFLHGAAYSSATWSELGILSGLAQQGYISYALDVPGYGQSTGSKVKDNKWLLKVIKMLTSDDDKSKELVEKEGGVSTKGKQFVLVTASMSGQYAVPLLFDPPSGMKGMVTVAPVGTDKFKQEQYEKVDVPVCIIYGALDTGLGEQSKANLVHIPNHQLIVIPDGEHAAYKTDPQFFYQQVVKWLEEFFD